jgi:type IX secretion system PorP/SprF family membrane protein
MYNMSVINPGYATDNLGVYNFGGIFRAQWVAANGSPNTASMFGHTTINENMETGLNIVHDAIGDGILNETNISGDLSYKIRLNYTSKLSVGIKAGANLFNTNFNGFRLNDEAIGVDNSFQNISEINFNIGAGLFYFTDNYYLGLSVPNFLANKQLKENSGINTIGVDEVHYFLTGGYVFDLNKNVKFKPAFMTKIVKDAPLSADLTANFLFNNKIEVGVSHRFNDSFSGLVNYKLSNGLRLGYAYDHTITNLGQFNSGSHELMLLFDLDTFGKKGYEKSPRFF